MKRTAQRWITKSGWMGVAAAAALLALLPAAASAQVEHRLRLQGIWTNPTDQLNDEDEGDRFEVAAEDAIGGRLAYELLLSERWGIELAAATSTHDVDVNGEGSLGGDFNLGEMRITPLTASLLFHVPAPGRADFFLGGGLAYVDYGDFELAGELDGEKFDVDAELTYTLQVGVDVELTEVWGLSSNLQWIDTDAEIDGDDLPIAPVTVGAGVALRF